MQIHSHDDQFIGVYFTLIALPYVAWSSALQAAPSARTAILIAGDVLSIVPYFAFQRGLAGVIVPSAEFQDPNLSWSDVWSFDTRIWYCILLMTVAGSVEWYYLYRLAHRREPKTKLSEDEKEEYCQPVDVGNNVDLIAEVERSVADDDGINARELVKTFIINKKRQNERKKQRVIKQAVKGVSLGIRQNELYALLGPNGAGKVSKPLFCRCVIFTAVIFAGHHSCLTLRPRPVYGNQHPGLPNFP